MTDMISSLVIPAILLIPALIFSFGTKEHFNAFTTGATDAFSTAVGLIPSLVLIMTAISMFSASGARELIANAASGVCSAVGIPHEILPLLLTRPFSGSAANGEFINLMESSSPDSFPVFAASVIMGSSDTLVYVISVYFSAAKYARHTRHAFFTAIISSIFCIFFSCFICRLMY